MAVVLVASFSINILSILSGSVAVDLLISILETCLDGMMSSLKNGSKGLKDRCDLALGIPWSYGFLASKPLVLHNGVVF